VKEKLIQSWRYKNLAVKKRHKNHLSLSLVMESLKFLGKTFNAMFPILGPSSLPAVVAQPDKKHVEW